MRTRYIYYVTYTVLCTINAEIEPYKLQDAIHELIICRINASKSVVVYTVLLFQIT